MTEPLPRLSQQPKNIRQKSSAPGVKTAFGCRTARRPGFRYDLRSAPTANLRAKVDRADAQDAPLTRRNQATCTVHSGSYTLNASSAMSFTPGLRLYGPRLRWPRAAQWRHTKSLGTPRHLMKCSHAPQLCHDFHPTGGAELETVIGDTRGMLPSLTSTRRGGSELACLDQAHQDLTHIGLHLESQQCIGPCHALIDGHDGLALLMRCQRKAVTRIHHQ